MCSLSFIFLFSIATYASNQDTICFNSGGSGKISDTIKNISFGSLCRVINVIKPTNLSKSISKTVNTLTSENPIFKQGEVYVFPNPSRPGTTPTIHAEFGIADYIKIEIFDIAGSLIYEVTIASNPTIINRGGSAQYAYEHTLSEKLASGVYICVVRAYKSGAGELKAITKFAVIR